MTETAKERIYREKLELISDKSMWHMNFKSSTIKMMMKNAKQALELAENLPVTTDKLSVEKLQEQLNTAKEYIEHVIGTIKHDGHLGTIQTDWILPDLEKALAVVEKGENNEI